VLEKRLTVSFADGRPINELLKRVFEERPDLPEQVALFEVEGGKTALFGAGDGHSLKLTIGFDAITRTQLEAIDLITQIATEFGATVEQAETLSAEIQRLATDEAPDSA